MNEQEKNTIIEELTSKLQNATQSEFDSIKSKLESLNVEALKAITEKDLVVKSDIESLKSLIEENNESIKEMKDISVKTEAKNVSLKTEIDDNFEAIKSLAKGQSRKEVQLKTTVTRASIVNNTQSVHLGTIGQLGVKRRALYDFFNKIPVSVGNHKGQITYTDWDEATIDRAAAAVAEGASFPESEAAFREYSKALVKIGDTLPVTEEFGEDQAQANAELQRFLSVNVATEIDRQLAVADGTSNTMTGLFNLAPAYSASASGIADANIKDLVRKMRTAIVKTRGSKYSPNFVAANSDVIDEYILKKDGDNNYMFDMNSGTIAGLAIVEDNNLADNTLVVGDGRFGDIYEMQGVTISEGMVNAQFTSDLKTIKARARLLFLIREVDKTGFLKSTDIAADLVTLASN